MKSSFAVANSTCIYQPASGIDVICSSELDQTPYMRESQLLESDALRKLAKV